MTLPYGETIFEHFRRPRNQGALAAASVSQEGSNPLCGDRVRVELRLEGETVVEAGFTANACAVCVAAASVLTDLVRGAHIEDVATFTSDELLRALGAELPRSRVSCATLPLTVLHTGVTLYRQRAREGVP
ncbi:MAG: iron-sulfur cluster assembly scaffold protein [Gemmatimonadetes bacterium]|nr:iron-sulfur cluster assembly scaffold protein [Gemmatimonadota bacterium]